jgi:hypothetical protein
VILGEAERRRSGPVWKSGRCHGRDVVMRRRARNWGGGEMGCGRAVAASGGEMDGTFVDEVAHHRVRRGQ